jgi:flagellar biosynthesis/type III secretory pathway M-ring protein FliF/YscJ
LVARKNGGRTVFTWELLAVLAIWAASLVAARPRLVVHSGPRWIGENMWVGIPVLIALVVFANFIAHLWRTRLSRKRDRLRNARLRSEGQQRRQEEKRKVAELRKEIDEVKRGQKEELRRRFKEEAELQKQQLLEEIQQEERLRAERLGRGMEGGLA